MSSGFNNRIVRESRPVIEMESSTGFCARNTNIEILRFLLMCFIFFWHILIHGYNLIGIGNGGVYGREIFLYQAFFLVLFSPATYCFVFISGYYGINFKLKKLVSLICCCITVSVAAYFYNVFCGNGHFEVSDFIRSFFPITSRRWWFMTDFVMLYILAPVINAGFDNLRKSHQKLVLLILFFFSSIGIVLLYPCCGSDLIGLIMIYLLARYIRHGGGNFEQGLLKYIFSFVFLSMMILALFYGSFYLNLPSLRKAIIPLLSFSNPLIIVMAVCLFFFFKNLPVYSNSLINRILSGNIFIFLITESYSFISYTKIANILHSDFLYGLLVCTASVMACLFVGCVVTWLVKVGVNYVFKTIECKKALGRD